MEDQLIKMTRDRAKSSSLKSTDVFRSNDPNAIITNIYIKKGIISDNIVLTVGEVK